jgi:hypothetical protein
MMRKKSSGILEPLGYRGLDDLFRHGTSHGRRRKKIAITDLCSQLARRTLTVTG